MNRSRGGFLSLGLTGYIAVAAGAVILMLALGLYIQTNRLEDTKEEYAEFVAGVKVLGEQAQIAAKAREAADKLKKENADAENKRTTDALRADNARLRNARAGSGYVPPAAPGANNPTVAAFDRAQLESAIGRLDAGVSGLVEQGDQARVDLDTAKVWAQP